MRRTTPLPERTHPEVLAAFPWLRQSTLAEFDSCRLSARWSIEGAEFDNAAQARGTLFHRFAAEVLRTLWRTGNTSIPTEEAMQILYETIEQRDVPDGEVVWCPARERRLLRILALRFASYPFRMERLWEVERRLTTTIEYVHHETGELVQRVITGQPDALLGDPPNGAVVLDWKTTRQAPAKGDDDDHHDDPEHVSYLGYFQQRAYGLLVLRNYPGVDRVTLREFYVLPGEPRYATVYRQDEEHLVRELSSLAGLLDRALEGGRKSPIWQPSPGKHCDLCPRPNHCPIEADVRAQVGDMSGGAGIGSRKDAERLAGDYVVAKTVGKKLHEALKSHVDVHGPIAVKSGKGRAELRWKVNKGGGRSFGLHVPDPSAQEPEDDPRLEEAFARAAERARAGA
jgi:hypothetical protein